MKTKTDGPLMIAGRAFGSRLLLGTGKFSSARVMKSALKASGTEIVTVALFAVSANVRGRSGSRRMTRSAKSTIP